NRPPRSRTFPSQNAASPIQLSRAPNIIAKAWSCRTQRRGSVTDSGGKSSTLILLLHAVVLWIWPRALQPLFKTFSFDVSLWQGDTVSRREGKAFWARHLVDTAAMWLKCNSTPPFQMDSWQTGSYHALP
ncbi:MAG TPA: hypothetical protein VJ723_05655, partial [Candidatus Angelobacter sp.]|nr:hypothetical protein [Candidatus Angelobacter sp.]